MLDDYLSIFVRFYGFCVTFFILVDDILLSLKMERLLEEGRIIRRKSQVDNKIMRFFRNRFYVPFTVWYLVNIINQKKYINKIEEQYLGNIESYKTDNNYIYLVLFIFFIPFKIIFSLKRFFYEIHIFFYLRLNKYIKY